MTDEQIEGLVARILQRLQPPVLVMVTAADGYRAAIRQRLAGSGYPLRLALEDGLADAAAWREVGEIIPSSAWQDALPSAPWRAVLLPFLDYPLASDLLNGTLSSPLARCAHEALLAGIPVLALRYHCDPLSELNQLRGAQADSAYAGHLQATLARLESCGVFLGTMNELLATLDAPTAPAAASGEPRRYLTVTDVVNNPALAAAPHAQLTDAAIDYLKNRKI
ncbi:hypothetical protein ACU611_20930 [Klebsiella aerogenes]|uniref:hypothetical protein n=1 Tax=Klebsiella aerogenes TaxID=548 RepID=UPI0007B3816A|nr:hypothetical protein [Klebsiella aerogenes]AWD01861.1 hypothetical protein AM407_02075 [Klebsiella aerogenes]ELA1891385.1 hypothetical protein [Klebsiella aerogenes]KZQ00425.1 hypothetical protein A3N42_05590 [Klebsiella aerogenes]MBX9000870.1 hypothetical protein [Klebsiella aerogenes]MCA4051526.1 hypothetical protein [Klebsiella aerogenes]